MNCPHCQKELTDEQTLALYADYCSRNLKGRTSKKKASASALNGKKGGRPKGSKNKIKPLAEVNGFQIYAHATGTENE